MSLLRLMFLCILLALIAVNDCATVSAIPPRTYVMNWMFSYLLKTGPSQAWRKNRLHTALVIMIVRTVQKSKSTTLWSGTVSSLPLSYQVSLHSKN